MSLKSHIGARVRTARRNAGLTQEQLAATLGKSVEMISNLERGHALTGVETLEQIATIIGVPISFFFEGFDDPSAPCGARRNLLDQFYSILATMTDEELALAHRLVRAIKAGSVSEK